MSEKNLVWTVDFIGSAKRELKRIEQQWRQTILDYLEKQSVILILFR